jgi:hypothetical protein
MVGTQRIPISVRALPSSTTGTTGVAPRTRRAVAEQRVDGRAERSQGVRTPARVAQGKLADKRWTQRRDCAVPIVGGQAAAMKVVANPGAWRRRRRRRQR